MAKTTKPTGQLSRRELLKGLSFAPLLLRPSPLLGAARVGGRERPPDVKQAVFAEHPLRPHYPARSPLDDVLRLVTPGLDEFGNERYAAELAAILRGWSDSLRRGVLGEMAGSFDASLRASPLTPTGHTSLRTGDVVEALQRSFPEAVAMGPERFLQELAGWLGTGTQVVSAEFALTRIEAQEAANVFATAVRYSVVVKRGEEWREQRTGDWALDWLMRPAENGTRRWQVTRWKATSERIGRVRGPMFADVTEVALGSVPSWNEQMLRGADDWRTVLDGACGIDVYGNNGVAAGDYNNDGRDGFYVCQPAGLPNRLYRNRGDGTFTDVTEAAGVGVLDNTACALFADFRNKGLQDLLVVCGSGPLLFVNQGDGTFQRKADAFRFAKPPQGTFTHAAIADYDLDGRLDLYFCLYSYYLGLDQYHYPAPYFDARNGPPNYLMHNEGDGTFSDRTEASGLNAENDRYSFACAWGHSTEGRAPDLYVVNDFGRNNLYRNEGNGTFRAVSEQAHVQDVGAGMSASWVDTRNDGHSGLYVANMWSAAGQRVSQAKNFHPEAPETVRALYQRHAEGNALYQGRGDGGFENVSEKAGVSDGGWAWCSDAWDFDQDGFQDLYVTNGYITGPSREAQEPDLASFFWRQVVAKSPNDATPSLAYEHGWNALNELIRSDGTWSGLERNVLLANNRDGTFTEVSGAVGLEFVEDGRSFALADLDGDGRLEMVLKNRNAPQLRILRNAMAGVGDAIAFRLTGLQSNRDAIGAAVTVVSGAVQQTRYVQAGTGFLAQHSKELHFGLGKGTDAVSATVRWPSGLTQTLPKLSRNTRVSLREGGEPTSTAFAKPAAAYLAAEAGASDVRQDAPAATVQTWLLVPLKAPEFSLHDTAGEVHTLQSIQGNEPALLWFFAGSDAGCRAQFEALRGLASPGAKAPLRVIAVNVESSATLDGAFAIGQPRGSAFVVLQATEEVAGVYNIIFRYLFDRRRDLPLPTAFLLDGRGMIVKVTQGSLSAAQVLEDLRAMPSTEAERVRMALPFHGELYLGKFARNDFTYGIAMFQHGYLEQAEASFQQVVAERPHDAEGYYNLGTLSLRRSRYDEATGYLQKALQLKPDYPEAWNNLGMMAAQQGRAEEAIGDLRKSLALRPGYATAMLNLGNVYRREHAYTEAEECLTEALKLQPDDPEVNYSVGMLYAQQNRAQEALPYLQRAVTLRPDYPEALNNLGVLYVHEGRYSAAEEQFRTCVRLVPDFEQSYLNLARLYVAQQKKKEAEAALQEMLRRNPNSVAGKQALQALAALP